MSNVLYVDATFDKVTHLSFAGYCDIFSNGRVFSKKFRDSNQAELFALRQCVNHCKEQLAMQRDTPLSFTIFAELPSPYIVILSMLDNGSATFLAISGSTLKYISSIAASLVLHKLFSIPKVPFPLSSDQRAIKDFFLLVLLFIFFLILFWFIIVLIPLFAN